jgi:DNA-directed RNA polymerase II subunit RPB2
METITWSIIDKYFKDNPYNLVAHHLDSYNDFITKGLFQVFKDNNPIRFIERDDSENIDSDIRNEVLLYLGGKNADKIYFGKPIIYDESHVHYMYPNQARLRNMTYGFTIHYDVDVEFTYYNGDQKVQESMVLEKIYLGKFPIMLHSKQCILKGMTTDARFNAGECKNDLGGYFIIDGKEKVILCQEKFADNMLYVRKNKEDDLYSYSCEVRSVSEDVSKPIRYTSVRVIAPDTKYTNNQFVVDIPNVRKPIPLFILMRALGVLSDKSIIEYCVLDLEKNSDYLDLFIPSIYDANRIFNQKTALEFIASFTKRQTISSTMDILMNYFLPHIGENNFLDKAYYIGFMVNKILKVITNQEPPTDRDNFKFKRVETSGNLLYQLFREYYIIQKREISLKIDKEFYYHKGTYRDNFISLISDNYKMFFQDRTLETGFKKAFKGNWGSDVNTKRIGVVQDLNRLSWFTFISHLRKIILPMDSSSKAVGPHLLHTTQWGFIDPIDTPDGGNIGLHKHMALSCAITNGTSGVPLIKWLRQNAELKLLQECSNKIIANSTKVFVNGNWVGVVSYPIETIKLIKSFRRNGVIPVYTSVSFDSKNNIIYLYTDDGRLTRPIFYKDDTNDKASFDSKKVLEIIDNNKFTWNQLVTGFKEKADEHFNIRNNILYFNVADLYPGIDNIKSALEFFNVNKGIIDYIDTSEEEGCLIATKTDELSNNKYYTNIEIDPSLILGVMGNSIIFPENNPVTRDTFSCGQSRQAVAVYNSNYQMRMDKMGVVLNYGQTPLIKSRYLEYINKEEQPYGVNAIVAIMCYTGYNVEDAILINEGAIQRGLFRTTYFTTYESHEEKTQSSGVSALSFFTNIQTKQNVSGLKPGCDYSQLDNWGLIKENTPVTDETVLIGKLTSISSNRDVYIDDSYKPKKGQLGFVDKSFITEGEEGNRIAKVRVREERLPGIGDKMASRAGQKGTLGLIIPEQDMPFTKDGIRPDLIINPHAIPSRMTIGQLVETLFGKACAEYGAFGDCTAFINKGTNTKLYGDMLVKAGFHSSATEIMYNGFSGEQIKAEIFIGPTYYMRLKHMVKDKINYRARGKRTLLTRQTNQGRADDGGLRIGEMERDGILAHGCSGFLNESYMVRGDEYYMAVCNKTGCIAVYNPAQNIFLSPLADGPLQFSDSIDGDKVIDVKSVYGRSFSIVRIPYSLKLLIQELQAMNIQMRLITEDNVDQLMNLSYNSNNIHKLLNEDLDKELKEVIDIYVKEIKEQEEEINQELVNKSNKEFMLENIIKEIEPQEDLDFGKQIASTVNIEEQGEEDVWMRFIDRTTKKPYYVNKLTNESVWFKPGETGEAPLMPGWKEYFDKNKNRKYYATLDRKNTTWVRPTMNPPVFVPQGQSQIPVRAQAPAPAPVQNTWKIIFDSKNNRPFYYNLVTKEKTWDKPAEILAEESMQEGGAINNTNNFDYIPINLQYYLSMMTDQEKRELLTLPKDNQIHELKLKHFLKDMNEAERTKFLGLPYDKQKIELEILEAQETLKLAKLKEDMYNTSSTRVVTPEPTKIVPPLLKVKDEALVKETEEKSVSFSEISKTDSNTSNNDSSSGVKKITI